MKITLIVLAILILLGIVIFLLIRKPEKVNDNSIVVPNSDSVTEPGSDADIDESFAKENHKPDVQENDACLAKGIDYSEKMKDSDENNNAVEEEDIEVHIPEHCKLDKCDEVLPNKYFFNIHKYTSKKGREMFCVVCSAVINNDNYRIIVKNSYYPYIKSYTIAIADRIRLMFENNNMTVDEFMKLGSTNFIGVGEIVESL